MYMGTSKDEVRKFVKNVADTRRNSRGCAIMTNVGIQLGESSSFEQDFVNSGLYDLYQKAQLGTPISTLSMLLEVLKEYPGFTEYFDSRQGCPEKSTPDLPWCEHVFGADARRFWGLY